MEEVKNRKEILEFYNEVEEKKRRWIKYMGRYNKEGSMFKTQIDWINGHQAAIIWILEGDVRNE